MLARYAAVFMSISLANHEGKKKIVDLNGHYSVY